MLQDPGRTKAVLPDKKLADGAVLTVLGLGSNRGDSIHGDPPNILRGAIRALEAVLEDLKTAGMLESEPLHVTDQSRFFNTAVSGFYWGEALELLDSIHKIEASFGRDRSREQRWGERTLDIDILLFGDQIISRPPLLEIPHPRLRERCFALVPLLELLPNAIDPLTGISYQSILDGLPDQGIYYPAP
ncbi:2-amino-4-hydroxy-6-hydroxymethyldihydropteridine diphosphokinase [Spirochaetia bacterium]|nr:2-amino-4-hydroxy-6-hydroxymethyldihydropteridine diphosphokinase [Spirochaetia bacterium]